VTGVLVEFWYATTTTTTTGRGKLQMSTYVHPHTVYNHNANKLLRERKNTSHKAINITKKNSSIQKPKREWHTPDEKGSRALSIRTTFQSVSRAL